MVFCHLHGRIGAKPPICQWRFAGLAEEGCNQEADFFLAGLVFFAAAGFFAALRAGDSVFFGRGDSPAAMPASRTATRAAIASCRVRSASNSSRVTRPRALRARSMRWRIILSISSRTPPRAVAAPFAILAISLMKFDRGAMLFPSPCRAAAAIGLRRGRLICHSIMSCTVLFMRSCRLFQYHMARNCDKVDHLFMSGPALLARNNRHRAS